MSAWTPGPWQVWSQGIEGTTGYWHFDVRSKDWHIVEDTVSVLGRTYQELEANTRLIALAPEMAEALRECAECLERSAPKDGRLRQAAVNARAMLARLEGGQS